MESDKEFASHKILWLLKNFISERMVVTSNSLSEDYAGRTSGLLLARIVLWVTRLARVISHI